MGKGVNAAMFPQDCQTHVHYSEPLRMAWLNVDKPFN